MNKSFYGMALLLLLSFTSGCKLAYLMKQGHFQAKMLLGREPIDKVIESGKYYSGKELENLHLVPKIKAFAEERLHLAKTKNYTTINPNFTRKMHNVTASRPLAFDPYTWWFPIVGEVPFLGFFVKKDALREAKKLQDKGYEVWVGQIGGFSTLGYFSDPIWPAMLKRSPGSLADLIVHELTHATLYFKGQSNFNESFASFVGNKGAELFLKEHFGSDNTGLQDYRRSRADAQKYRAFMHELFKRLDKVYKSSLVAHEKTAAKKRILAEGDRRLSKVQFETKGYQGASIKHINNAFLMGYKRYYRGQEQFEALFVKVDRNFERFLEVSKAFEGSKDPFKKLKEVLASDLGAKQP